MQTRRERLLAPLSWWIAAAAFAIAWGWVALVVAGPGPALTVAVVVAVAAFTLLWSYGATVVEAGPTGLRVGSARLGDEHVGAVRTLGSADTRAVLGPEADARAWLHVRPYIPTAVQVEVRDPADPAPYWVVSTRDPAAVARALGRPVEHPSTEPQPRSDPR